MSAHPTPGSWSYKLNKQNSAFSVYGDGILVCSMSWHSSYREQYPLRDESEANAALIAACPAMYAYIERRAESGDEQAKEIMEAIHARR